MSTQSKDYEIRDGKIIRYVQLESPREALQALADNDGKPVDGFAFRDDHISRWQPKELKGYDGHYHCPWCAVDEDFEHCARIVEEDPLKVPEGVPELPEPWLAYVEDKERVKAARGNDLNVAIWSFEPSKANGWRCSVWDITRETHYAIDVRTDFANEHFPQIVEAMEYEEPDPFEEWWKEDGAEIAANYSPYRATNEAWDAAIAWKESQNKRQQEDNT